MAVSIGDPVGVPEAEHHVYATVLRRGVWIGMSVLACTFLLYVAGVVSPVVPIQDLPQYWGLRAHEYLRRADLPQGWGWVLLASRGDVLNFVGVAVLAGLTIVAYLRILPILARRRDLAYVFIVVAEIAILLLAASGIFTLRH